MNQVKEPSAIITQKGRQRVRAAHQWVYRSDIKEVRNAGGGQLLRVFDSKGRLLGKALYSDRSLIALRFITFEDEEIDREFWRKRLRAAAQFRRQIVSDTESYRLVHAEGDFLSSLIIDVYNDVFVLQTLSQGMETLKQMWVELLIEEFSPRSIVERNDVKVRELEGLPLTTGVLHGLEPGEIIVTENGIKFYMNPLQGQKTGAFLDQRENRRAASFYGRGRALDCFSFHGAFGLNLAGRAESVTCIDSSSAAIAQARRNAELNNISNIEFIEANVFNQLKAYDERGERFDTIVLDPPAFAKNRQSLEGALRGYKEINLRAMKILNPGGVLITCTCSQHVTEELFLGVLAEAAADAHRTAQIVEKRMQSRDHPVLLSVPETYYLKCMILRIA